MSISSWASASRISVGHDQLGILALGDAAADVQERVVERVHAGTPEVSW